MSVLLILGRITTFMLIAPGRVSLLAVGSCWSGSSFLFPASRSCFQTEKNVAGSFEHGGKKQMQPAAFWTGPHPRCAVYFFTLRGAITLVVFHPAGAWSFSVSELAAPGVEVGRLTATDPDLGENAQLEFTILDGEEAEIFNLTRRDKEAVIVLSKVSGETRGRRVYL